MEKNDTTRMSQPEKEHDPEWDEIVAEVIDEDRDLLDRLAD